MNKVIVVLSAFALFCGSVLTVQAQNNVPKGIYYTANDGTNFSRSTNPFKDGDETQSQNPRHVTVSISNQTGYADSGFVLFTGKLSTINSITLTGRGDDFGLNFWFDVSGDSDFF